MKKLMFWLVLIFSISALIGSCGKSDDATKTTIPAAPTGVSLTAGWHQIELDWDDVSGATSYTLYRGTSSGVFPQTKTGVATSSHTSTDLDNGTTYYYKVAAVNSAGTSDPSGEFSATPRTGPSVTEACTFGEAAYGTVSGLHGAVAGGTYYHSWQGESPSDGCIDNSSAISAFSQVVASGTKSVKHALIIQGNGNAVLDSWNFYMNDNCTKQSGFMSFYHDNLTVGDNITGADNATGYPAEATKVWYQNNYICTLAETDEQLTTLNTLFDGGITLTKGTVVDQANGTDNNTVIWTALDNISGQSVWFYSDDNENPYHPVSFDDGDSTAWHTGDNITE